MKKGARFRTPFYFRLANIIIDGQCPNWHLLKEPRKVQPGRVRRPAVLHARSYESDLFPVPEVDVRAAAGAGSLNDEEPSQVGAWPLSTSFIEQELRTSPSALRVISVRGDSMLPTMSNGDRIMVDTSHKRPSPPGVYVLWDGARLVAKRVAIIPGDPTQVRLHSDKPLYPAYDCT
jgi:phage repressor protein C with HTH and peptisase S24 domain